MNRNLAARGAIRAPLSFCETRKLRQVNAARQQASESAEQGQARQRRGNGQETRP
jgi:hypothetical protein